MRLAIHCPAVPMDPTVTPGTVESLATAVRACGWNAALCPTTGAILDAAPDAVLAVDALAGKLTPFPTIGWARIPPAHVRTDWSRLKRLLSHDGHLTATAEIAEFLDDTWSPTDRISCTAMLPEGPAAAITKGLAGLPDLIERVRAAGHFPPPAKAESLPRVDLVVRVGGRDRRFVARALDAIARQTYPAVGAVIVRYAPVAGLDEEIAAVRPRLAGITLIDVPPGSTRSTALWAGVMATQGAAWGILDDDDSIHPNHVASLMAALWRGPEGVAYAGAIRTLEAASTPGRCADSGRENRSLFYFEPPRLDRFLDGQLFIHSCAFLARGALRPHLGPDPRLHFAEDTYLLRRLARVTDFRPSWRATAEFHWREEQTDNTAFQAGASGPHITRMHDRERLDVVLARRRTADRETDVRDAPPGWGDVAEQPPDPPPTVCGPADILALPGGTPLYVYGTGRGARLVCREIQKFAHLRMTAFLDAADKDDFLELPVLKPDGLSTNERARCVVVVASQYVNDIAARLRAQGYNDLRNAYPYILRYIALSSEAPAGGTDGSPLPTAT